MATDTATTSQQPTTALYVRLEGTTLKMGTCDHCVIREPGRPERAWEPDGDKELDFPRNAFIAAMAALGVTVKIEQEYVCP